MLNKQDFAQSEPKSPVKRRLELVVPANQCAEKKVAPSDSARAFKLLEETIIKIDGAYAPSTIRAYRADFINFINFCLRRFKHEVQHGLRTA
ncbi:Core-binding (CB) domain-containing protein [Polynucleobacter antarcticus]|uniref:Uncharacterized protein n=1 Tax=Polynucleobacter antarcticus TaxID=1743162 RepID=A0A6M9PJI4_9BURK|nr:hypothetical protein DCO16_03995 [Polynucleobacter antarcticus]